MDKSYSGLYRDTHGELMCEGVELREIAKAHGTPTYVYSKQRLIENCDRFLRAFKGHNTTICFAVKANGNLSLLKTIFGKGLGADIVSEGELARAIKSGCPPEKIVFSGVGKKLEEIEKALSFGVKMFNIESPFELDMIGQVAEAKGRRAKISFRINPHIDAKTHAKIATGLKETKFGLPEEDLPELLAKVRRQVNLELVGLSCHIGSQITQIYPLRDTAQRMAQISRSVLAEGFSLKYLDLGGGLGIPYQNEPVPSVQEYASTLLEFVKPLGLELVIEPGRAIIGDVGFLLSQVIGVKTNLNKSFVILDAAMNDLIRPALYDSYHPIIPVGRVNPKLAQVTAHFVGPICETGDVLGLDRLVELPERGDLFAIGYAGAYGSSMSSQYNSRPRAQEVMVFGHNQTVIRRRERLEDLWSLEEE